MTDQYNEQKLVKGCKKRQRIAQKHTYERYAPAMLSLCRRYLPQSFEAEDALTNGFLRVFQKIEQFREEGSFEGWIKRIMVNECLNRLRKQRFLYAETSIESADNQEKDAEVEQVFAAEELMTYINALPSGYRTVFNLYALEGYNHQEIGDMLGISESTSKSQLSRARKLLQTQLKTSKSQKHSNHG